MDKKEFNKVLERRFDDMNSIGLGELLIFGLEIERFIESPSRLARLVTVVTDICGYHTSAREFVKMISYEDFKSKKGMSEITALGLKLFLMYSCGVDWKNPQTKMTGLI